jgi:hypothetical protein
MGFIVEIAPAKAAKLISNFFDPIVLELFRYQQV